jgi:hypothetical protein
MPHVQSSIDGHMQRMPHSMISLARRSSAIRASISASLVSASARLTGRPGGVIGEQQLDLVQCEAGGLAQPDHFEAGDDRLVVMALTADPGGGLNEADPLVVAQGGRRDVRLKRQLADRQGDGHESPLVRGLT